MVLTSDGTGYNVKEREAMHWNLIRLSFGPLKKQPLISSGQPFELSYCVVEMESTTGIRETFPCVLQDLTMRVQYADAIGKEKLVNTQLAGITFRAGE